MGVARCIARTCAGERGQRRAVGRSLGAERSSYVRRLRFRQLELD
jgi:hypothetical protein